MVIEAETGMRKPGTSGRIHSLFTSCISLWKTKFPLIAFFQSQSFLEIKYLSAKYYITKNARVNKKIFLAQGG